MQVLLYGDTGTFTGDGRSGIVVGASVFVLKLMSPGGSLMNRCWLMLETMSRPFGNFYFGVLKLFSLYYLSNDFAIC